VPDVFNTFLQKIAFAEFEREAIFLTDFKATLQVVEHFKLADGVQEDVVDNNAVTSMLGSKESGGEEHIPLGGESVHHTGVYAMCVARSERHDAEGIFLAVEREGGKLVLVASADGPLMVATAGVQTNKKDFAGGITKIVDSVLAARDRVQVNSR
jgi:hypothetical protein